MNNSQLKISHQLDHNRKVAGEILFFLFLIVFALIALRFAYVSIFKNAHNVDLVKQTHQLYTQTNVIKPRRGTIYDANGQPIAEDSSTYSVYLVLNHRQKTIHGKPLYVTDPDRVAKVLSSDLSISAKRIRKSIQLHRNAFQISLGNAGQNLSLTTKRKIDRAHLSGVHFNQQQSRLYPNGVFASHLIGLAAPVNSKDQVHLKGQMGIESAFNRQLAGHDGYRQIAQNNFLDSSHRNRPVKNGDNVYTTLDYRLQSLLEDRMSSVYKSVHPSAMGAVLMNARTGDILAATQRPSFNSTTKRGINSIWRNVLTQDLYEPGSTMKAFTIAASINSHHYHGNDTYNSGKYYLDGKLIPDWDPNGWGQIDFNKGFALSSNVAMAHLERQMGSSTWLKYIRRFKLLDPVNVGLGNDAPGILQFRYPLEQADSAFGQGIEVNTMQMLRGLSAISNNGRMLQPHLISKVVSPKNHRIVHNYRPRVVGQPISENTAAQVRKHMEDVVYKPYGIGHDYQIHGYRIAAKTGTAQISNGKHYSSGNDSYLYSVAGMAPANHPKYVLYITMKQPKLNGRKTASQDLAAIFNPVMKSALNGNQRAIGSNLKRLPNLNGKSVRNARRILRKLGLKPFVVGNQPIVKRQSIQPGSRVVPGSRIVIISSH